MESQPSQSPPPDAKPGTPSPTPAASTVPQAIRRTYPKPPPLLMRLILLCLRPESWAETAQYPTWVTLVPLFLAVLLGALAIAASGTWHSYKSVRDFAAGYDAKGYPALEISSAGVLSTKGSLEQPIRADLPFLTILVDPTGKTTAETVVTPCVFVSAKQVSVVAPDRAARSAPLTEALQVLGVELPPAGQIKSVSSKTMLSFLDNQAALFIGAGTFVGFLMFAFGETLWVLLMLFMLCPLIVLVAAGPRGNSAAPDRRLLLPRRAAYRMAAGLLVPLVTLAAVLRSIGHPAQDLLGPEKSMLFWIAAAASLAVWTGLMAKKMYGPKERRR